MKAAGPTLLIVLLAFPAMAQPSTIPFGLDGIRWRMEREAVRAIYEKIVPRAPLSRDAGPVNQVRDRMFPYRWKDCVLDVTFYFAEVDKQAALSRIDVHSADNASPACLQSMRDEVIRALGTPSKEHRYNRIETLDWDLNAASARTGIPTTARYNTASYPNGVGDANIRLVGDGVPQPGTFFLAPTPVNRQ